MAHSLFRLAPPFVLALTTLAGSAYGVPDALPISETAHCRVALTKVSYDGPGADDDEFVELVVERLAPLGAPVHSTPAGDSGVDAASAAPCRGAHDAGPNAPDGNSGPDAEIDATSRALTLADCGLSELRLVDGAGGACSEYRVIPLGAVSVPDDGYVVVCAEDSVLHGCDVTTAGRSALKNGFLQNGPNDGLRFVGSAGGVALEVRYEGGPACFAPTASSLVDETGEISGAPGEDDVNVVCGGHFVLRAASDAPMRRGNPCASRSAADGGDGAPPAPVGTTDPLGNPSPEYVPDGGSGYPSFSLPDSGLDLVPKPSSAPAAPPACTFSRAGNTGRASPWLRVAPALALLFVRRRRPRRGLLRAGSSVRCASAPRRSP